MVRLDNWSPGAKIHLENCLTEPQRCLLFSSRPTFSPKRQMLSWEWIWSQGFLGHCNFHIVGIVRYYTIQNKNVTYRQTNKYKNLDRWWKRLWHINIPALRRGDNLASGSWLGAERECVAHPNNIFPFKSSQNPYFPNFDITSLYPYFAKCAMMNTPLCRSGNLKLLQSDACSIPASVLFSNILRTFLKNRSNQMSFLFQWERKYWHHQWTPRRM